MDRGCVRSPHDFVTPICLESWQLQSASIWAMLASKLARTTHVRGRGRTTQGRLFQQRVD
ncbi:hypothetical protein VFPFJ_05758 [Purpureocillium lilacinum]|uniref:Uncharacterized protein n=1 Tax=Purpureocillium lilacinum TaxID=33203 RepID=A0A179HIR4_PURLI|nr:hypothetical protein VFPFJ_05758 [Purpureocillium lilacinum]OAQ89349.1 hypothetical protein VFPFJ_05758 [Purpureocillium lilacinum]